MVDTRAHHSPRSMGKALVLAISGLTRQKTLSVTEIIALLATFFDAVHLLTTRRQPHHGGHSVSTVAVLF